MPLYDPNLSHDPRPCVNYRTCRGHAVDGRAKCDYCIMADENEDAAKDAKKLAKLERKPRTVEDAWR
jgi:hypothetical protein